MANQQIIISKTKIPQHQTFEQFEEAVEYDELSQFLRRSEPWDPSIDDEGAAYGLVEKPTGVPGAYTPHQMTGQTASHAPKGAIVDKAVREGEMDLGMIRWLKFLNNNVDADYKQYNHWPIWIEAQLDKDLTAFGRSLH